MHIDKKLETLKTIRPVEAPPFLYTRIKERIDSWQKTAAPLRWKIAFVSIVLIVLFLNIGVVIKISASKKAGRMEGVVSALQLSSSNDLYHE
jgi:hypothetical protein